MKPRLGKWVLNCGLAMHDIQAFFLHRIQSISSVHSSTLHSHPLFFFGFFLLGRTCGEGGRITAVMDSLDNLDI